MIFSNHNRGTIYIQKNSLTFYDEGDENRLEFPVDIISNGDIIDPAKYEKLVEDFIATKNIKKQQILLILAEEVVFKKIIPSANMKISNDNIDDFINMIPFEREKLVKKTLKLNEDIYIFAANRQLFEKIINILEKFSFEILAVVPLPIYSPENKLTEDIIEKIFKEKQLLKEANFLSDDQPQDKSTLGKGIPFIIVFLIMIIFILGFLLINGNFKFSIPFLMEDTKLVLESPQIQANPISTESSTPKISSPSAIKNADQLKVVVLNGTGITGQASKIKDLLTQFNLSNIETDNAQGIFAKDTIVIFSQSVAEELQVKITTLLEENFDTVSPQKNISSQSADILITTGKPKIVLSPSP